MNLDLNKVAGGVRGFMQRSMCGDVSDGEFERIALRLFSAQRKNNPAYAKLCESRGVGEVDNWGEIPAVPTAAFKELEMTSLGPDERGTVFYSSGTTKGDRSRHFHSVESLGLYEESVWLWFSALFRAQIPDVRWIVLTPSAKAAPNSSLAHMFSVLVERSGGNAVFCGIADEDGWRIDFPLTFAALKTSESKVAILGTAFLFVNLLDELERLRVRLPLPRESWILETGGYKGRTREVPKQDLHQLLKEQLGVRHIFSEYGMSELSSQAYGGTKVTFRLPPWARVQMISPATGREVKEGERGLIRVYDLANVWSVLAVQTEDVGIKVGDGFELLGRAAAAEARGCSLMSVEGDEDKRARS